VVIFTHFFKFITLVNKINQKFEDFNDALNNYLVIKCNQNYSVKISNVFNKFKFYRLSKKFVLL